MSTPDELNRDVSKLRQATNDALAGGQALEHLIQHIRETPKELDRVLQGVRELYDTVLSLQISLESPIVLPFLNQHASIASQLRGLVEPVRSCKNSFDAFTARLRPNLKILKGSDETKFARLKWYSLKPQIDSQIEMFAGTKTLIYRALASVTLRLFPQQGAGSSPTGLDRVDSPFEDEAAHYLRSADLGLALRARALKEKSDGSVSCMMVTVGSRGGLVSYPGQGKIDEDSLTSSISPDFLERMVSREVFQGNASAVNNPVEPEHQHGTVKLWVLMKPSESLLLDDETAIEQMPCGWHSVDFTVTADIPFDLSIGGLAMDAVPYCATTPSGLLAPDLHKSMVFLASRQRHLMLSA